jgi:hypothetical protein
MSGFYDDVEGCDRGCCRCGCAGDSGSFADLTRWIFRWSVVVVLALAVWLGFGFFGAQRACAHDPRFACSPRDEQHAIAIMDPAKSWAYYGRLRPGQRDVYGLFVNDVMSVPVSVLIEKVDASNAARPVLTVVDSSGRVVARRNLRKPVEFFEPFSRIDYLTSEQTAVLLEPGLYQAFVDMRGGGGAQRYVFAVGAEERFGVGEIPYVLGAIWRARTVGY